MQNIPGTPGAKPESIPGTSGIVTKVYPYPGYCATAVEQSSQKFRVHVVCNSYRTHRNSGYGMEVLQKLTNVPGRYTNVVPVPRVSWHGRTELTEVSGTGMNVLQNSQKFRARVWKAYRNCTSSSTGYTPCMVLYVLQNKPSIFWVLVTNTWRQLKR